MKIDFDPVKSERNTRLRSLSFDRAVDFDWEDAVIIPDARKTYPEIRFVAVACFVLRAHRGWTQDYQFSQGKQKGGYQA